MTEQKLQQKIREKVEHIEKNQILGVYDSEEELDRGVSWNEGYISGYEDGYIAGAKENGIVWHNLKTNPNDLPNDDRDVINERGMLVWCRDGVWYESDILTKIRAYPVAWCEIPKFEEEE